MHGFNGWYMGGMWIWWIVIAAIVIGAAWFAVFTARRGGTDTPESPEKTLKRRYARGELDHETYERMLADLRS